MDVEVSTPRKQRREKLDGTEECGRSDLVWCKRRSAASVRATLEQWRDQCTPRGETCNAINLVVTMNGRGTDVKVLVERALLTRKSANHSSGALAFSPIRAKTGTSE